MTERTAAKSSTTGQTDVMETAMLQPNAERNSLDLPQPPLTPPLLLGRDLAQRRQLWSKHLERKSRSALLTDTVTGKPIPGSPCRRCGRSVEIMARLSVSDRELSRRSFMLVWPRSLGDLSAGISPLERRAERRRDRHDADTVDRCEDRDHDQSDIPREVGCARLRTT
jgi:hypothetical protein